MSNNPAPSERPTFWWTLFVLMSTVIFAFTPYANVIRKALAAEFGTNGIRWVLVFLVVMGAAGALVFVLRHRHVFRLRNLPRMLLVPMILSLWIYHIPLAVEAFHLVEYVLLGALAFRTLSCSFRDATVYPAAVALTVLVGATDEFVQWWTPGRFWTLADIGLNVAGGVLAQVWIAMAWSPSWSFHWPERNSRHRAALFITLCLVLAALMTSVPARSGKASYLKTVYALPAANPWYCLGTTET